MDMAEQSDFLAGAKVVDVDTHLSEPHDLWTARAPARLRDRVPQVRQVNGKAAWFIDGDRYLGIDYPISTIRKDGSPTYGTEHIAFQMEDVHPASYDGAARVRLLDEQGIWAQVIYPNIMGFQGRIAARVDPELRLVSVQLYNDAVAEMQRASANRLVPMAVLPWWDIDLSIKEAERVAGLGMRGVSINPEPHLTGGLDLGDPAWDPFWSACGSLDLPVSFHIGSSDSSYTMFTDGAWPSLSREENMAVGGANVFLGNVGMILNIIMSGVLERHPDVRIVSVESGLGWVPFILNALDYQVRHAGASSATKIKLTPSEYFTRQCYATFWFEGDHLAEFVRMLGPDICMFETDFPHPVCLYPDPVGKLRPALEGLSPTDRGKIMGGNAMKLYRLES